MKNARTEAKVIDILGNIEKDLMNDVSLPQFLNRNGGPEAYAPRVVRDQLPPLPAGVEHKAHVGEIGRMSSHAIVDQYERAAKAIETMGAEMIAAVKACEQLGEHASFVHADVMRIAELHRAEGRAMFNRIQDCAILVNDVQKTCAALAAKISVNVAPEDAGGIAPDGPDSEAETDD